MTVAPSPPGLPPAMLDRTDLTVADVAHLSEDLRYELINGRLVLSPSATTLHNIICRAIVHAIEVGCPPDYVVGDDQSIVLDSHNERRPDVVVLEASEVARSPVFHADVLLVVEVVSPGSVVQDRREKLKEYAYSGIPSYWIVDPRGKRISFSQFLLGDGAVYRRHVHGDGLITVDLPWEVTLDLPALTRRRDDLLRATRARHR